MRIKSATNAYPQSTGLFHKCLGSCVTSQQGELYMKEDMYVLCARQCETWPLSCCITCSELMQGGTWRWQLHTAWSFQNRPSTDHPHVQKDIWAVFLFYLVLDVTFLPVDVEIQHWFWSIDVDSIVRTWQTGKCQTNSALICVYQLTNWSWLQRPQEKAENRPAPWDR